MQTYTQINNDPAIEQDIISTVVTLLENGLPSCHLVANNYKGKLYLQSLKLYSKVTVKFAYEDNASINWTSVDPIFTGRIVDISPEMTSRGETLVATALTGECLKQVRVNKEYLTGVKEEVSISGDYDVNGLINRINQWTRIGTSPYLHFGDADYIYVNVTSSNAEDGDYTIKDIPIYEEYNVQNLTLNVRGFVDTAGGNATVKIKVTQDNGTTWQTFGDFNFDYTGITNQTVNVVGAINMSNFNNTKIAVLLSSGANNTANTCVRVYAVWFHIDGVGRNYYHYKLRDILQDIKNDSIDKLLGLTVTQPSDYTLNLDYAYDYTKEYPYMNFPFTDAIYTLNELIKIGSSMSYVDNPSNYRGLHWIVQYDSSIGQNRLLVAPVGNHSVYGANNSCYIKDKWDDTCPLNPIVVKEDMIHSNFKTEIPLANVILVAGKFIHPKDDVWTEKLEGWNYQKGNVGGFIAPTVDLSLNNTTTVKGVSSLQFRIGLNWLNQVWAILYRPFTVDLTKLVSTNIPAFINMQIYGNMHGEEIKLRLYCNTSAPQLTYNGSTYDCLGSYFEYDLSLHLPINAQEKWHKIEVPVTSKDLSNVQQEGVWTAHNDSGYSAPTWNNIKWLLIWVKTYQGPLLGEVDNWLFDDMCIVGSLIRGAYTSDCGQTSIDNCTIGCIKHYGIRTYTIKDSLAQTDNLDPNDNNSTLSQIALYELLRHRIPRTTASIQIPLYPSIKAGQIVRIKYNQLDNGTYVIDTNFRITKVTHQYSVEGAKTILEITDDVRNSLPISTTDPYTVLLRAINPDTQTKTFTSLKQAGSFETGMSVLWHDPYNT
jgi:hypothetical protein